MPVCASHHTGRQVSSSFRDVQRVEFVPRPRPMAAESDAVNKDAILLSNRPASTAEDL